MSSSVPAAWATCRKCDNAQQAADPQKGFGERSENHVDAYINLLDQFAPFQRSGTSQQTRPAAAVPPRKSQNGQTLEQEATTSGPDAPSGTTSSPRIGPHRRSMPHSNGYIRRGGVEQARARRGADEVWIWRLDRVSLKVFAVPSMARGGHQCESRHCRRGRCNPVVADGGR